MEPLFAIWAPLQFVYVCKLRKNKDVYEKLIKNYLKSTRAVSCELWAVSCENYAVTCDHVKPPLQKAYARLLPWQKCPRFGESLFMLREYDSTAQHKDYYRGKNGEMQGLLQIYGYLRQNYTSVYLSTDVHPCTSVEDKFCSKTCCCLIPRPSLGALMATFA